MQKNFSEKISAIWVLALRKVYQACPRAKMFKEYPFDPTSNYQTAQDNPHFGTNVLKILEEPAASIFRVENRCSGLLQNIGAHLPH